MRSDTESYAGLYIHIPFCLKKCPYCDFFSQPDLSKKGSYINALISEMALTKADAPVFDTIYFGGGTPSLLTSSEVDLILSSARTAHSIHPEAEITLEVNPGTTDLQTLKDYRRAGVNRISLGVQSFNHRHLRKLGRIHSVETSIMCLDQISQAGYDNVGIDLIYGLPAQTINEWENDLTQALRFLPQHLSCYILAFESGTPFNTQRSDGRIRPLGDAVVAELYKETVRLLSRQGYCQYEVSNFALPGQRSRHNAKYWNNTLYLGLGAGAHSYDGGCRSWNVNNIDAYVQALADGVCPLAGKETLTRHQKMLEAIYLGLRTTAGIPIMAFNKRFGVSFGQQCDELLIELHSQGYVQNRRDRVALSIEGMLLLDTIATRISEQLGDFVE